ncbi:hypothetical protein DYB30_010406 [Aphanomyces astaci]|uniref:DDE-1 domain-containing protein n=1 Tax=Aphanomyces astaci TaxID=112090 RepID=A0A397C5S2_APHAT|nr:hypothetical protein DYB30_010406 [Aphanomyces astaci]
MKVDCLATPQIDSLLDQVSPMEPKGIQHRPRPFIAQKLQAVVTAQATGVREAARQLGYAERAVRLWVQEQSKLASFEGSKTRKKNTGNCGAKPILPAAHALVTYMKDLRRHELAVTSSHFMQFLREDNMEWIVNYMVTRKEGYKSLLRLMQRFADRHGFPKQRVCRQKKTQEDLESTCFLCGQLFHDTYPDLSPDCLYNADETGIYFDMCPSSIWAVRGGDSYAANSETHSYWLTALLTVRADGLKLPILFVIRGEPGGVIETNEFNEYPPGHFYAMQKKAWMNGDVWRYYLRDVLAPIIENPSVLLVDNFDSHITDESERIVGDELGSEICALPPNSTSHCQPLDVSLMGPFKQHLRDLWVITQNTATTAKEKRIVMFERAIKAWDMITEEEVRASFVNALPKQA